MTFFFTTSTPELLRAIADAYPTTWPWTSAPTDDIEEVPDAPDDEVALPDTDPVPEPVPENDEARIR